MAKNIFITLVILTSLSANYAHSMGRAFPLLRGVSQIRYYSDTFLGKEKLIFALASLNKIPVYEVLYQFPNCFKNDEILTKMLLEFACKTQDDFLRFHVERACKKDEYSTTFFTPLVFSSVLELEQNIDEAIKSKNGLMIAHIFMFNGPALKNQQKLLNKILYFAVDINHFFLSFQVLAYSADPESLHTYKPDEDSSPVLITPLFLSVQRNNTELTELLLYGMKDSDLKNAYFLKEMIEIAHNNANDRLVKLLTP